MARVLGLTFTKKAADEMGWRVAVYDPAWMDRLNAKQRAAVMHGEGPARVAAAAGSGKTLASVCRAARLAGSIEKITMGTFHSVCLRLLKKYREVHGEPPLKVLEDYGRKAIVRNALRELAVTSIGPADVIHMMSAGKSNGLGPREWREECQRQKTWEPPLDDVILSVWSEYEIRKDARGEIDFDDMVIVAYEQMRDDVQWRERVQCMWDFCQSDEYQDVNLAQEKFLRLLCARHRNLFVAGDTRQAIYSFRGGSSSFLLDFDKAWPDATTYDMSENYRCGRSIIGVANSLIAKNTRELGGEVVAMRDWDGEIQSFAFDTAREEADFAAGEIATFWHENLGTPLHEIVVSYRTNSQSRSYEAALSAQQIPYIVIGGTGFWSRAVVKDMVAYLHLISGKDNPAHTIDDAIRRIYNKPNRYFGKVGLETLAAYAADRKMSMLDAIPTCAFTKPFLARAARDLHTLILGLRRFSRPSELIAKIRIATDYDEWLKKEEGDEGADSIVTEELEELEEAADQNSLGLGGFLAYAYEQQDRNTRMKDEDTKGKVQLMSTHRVKGLEWEVVFIAGCSDGIFPHIKNANVEEERRLLFVGITRAKHKLYLLSHASRNGQRLGVSRFLAEGGVEVVNRCKQSEVPNGDARREDSAVSEGSGSVGSGDPGRAGGDSGRAGDDEPGQDRDGKRAVVYPPAPIGRD